MPDLPFTLAVLFALPTTESEFVAAARASPPGDYLASVLGGRSPDQAWAGRDGFHRVAAAATALAERTTALGGRVVRGAALDDLFQATHTCDVVVICAHWRGEAILGRDLLGSPAAILSTLRAIPGPQGETIRRELADVLPADEGEMGRRDLARALNRSLDSSALHALLGLHDPREREVLGSALTRATIDLALGPLIAPGNRLELGGNLVGEAEIDRAVAPGFGGELDLSACQSAYLARSLALRRGDARPRPLFHHNRQSLEPIARFLVLREVLDLCAADRLPYHQGRAKVELALISAFREAGRSEDSRWAWLRSLIATMFLARSSGSRTGARS